MLAWDTCLEDYIYQRKNLIKLFTLIWNTKLVKRKQCTTCCMLKTVFRYLLKTVSRFLRHFVLTLKWIFWRTVFIHAVSQDFMHGWGMRAHKVWNSTKKEGVFIICGSRHYALIFLQFPDIKILHSSCSCNWINSKRIIYKIR